MINHVFASTPMQTAGLIIMLILCLYPIAGAFFWFFGSLSYRWLRNTHEDDDWEQLPPEKQPFVTIMIPAHNEEVMIESTIDYLFQ